MATTWIRCPVLGGHVTRVTDFEGNVTRIICEEYEELAGTCRLRRTVLQGGPLTQLLGRVSEETLDTGGTLCVAECDVTMTQRPTAPHHDGPSAHKRAPSRVAITDQCAMLDE